MAMDRRDALAAVAVLGGLSVSGCATSPRKTPDGRYCYWGRTAVGSRPVCTPGPVPDMAADARAKQFEAVAERLVVFVVRHRWADTLNVVDLGIDTVPPVATVPASLVRLEMAPGAHRLSFEWTKGKGALEVRGDAGQVLFVDLVGSLWAWNEWYRLEVGEPSIRHRALKCRLVADVKVGV